MIKLSVWNVLGNFINNASRNKMIQCSATRVLSCLSSVNKLYSPWYMKRKCQTQIISLKERPLKILWRTITKTLKETSPIHSYSQMLNLILSKRKFQIPNSSLMNSSLLSLKRKRGLSLKTIRKLNMDLNSQN